MPLSRSTLIVHVQPGVHSCRDHYALLVQWSSEGLSEQIQPVTRRELKLPLHQSLPDSLATMSYGSAFAIRETVY